MNAIDQQQDSPTARSVNHQEPGIQFIHSHVSPRDMQAGDKLSIGALDQSKFLADEAGGYGAAMDAPEMIPGGSTRRLEIGQGDFAVAGQRAMRESFSIDGAQAPAAEPTADQYETRICQLERGVEDMGAIVDGEMRGLNVLLGVVMLAFESPAAGETRNMSMIGDAIEVLHDRMTAAVEDAAETIAHLRPQYEPPAMSARRRARMSALYPSVSQL